jgi:hypothetical protein
VRGIEACTALSQRLGLHVLQKKKAKLTFMECITGTRNIVTHQDAQDKQTEKSRPKSTVGRTFSSSGTNLFSSSTVVPSPKPYYSPSSAHLHHNFDWSDDVQTISCT